MLRGLIVCSLEISHLIMERIPISPVRTHARSIPHRAARRGFTLIEVMIVVVILGLLAAVVVPKVMNRPDEARVVKAQADIAAIVQALKLYRLDNTTYPTTEQGLNALVQRPTGNPIPNNWKQGGYLDKLPKDPWGRDYQFLNPGTRGEIDVFSLGADGQPGGQGMGADIFN